MVIYSLQFWTLVVALLVYVVKYYFPIFPFDNAQILAAVLFLLGLIGVVPQAQLRGASFGDLLHSKAFWTLVAGIVAFLAHFFAPEFPLDGAVILALIVFVLNSAGINPELRRAGIL